MQSANFVVLTGHLNDYPLADLIGILRHQGKTGRLIVEYNLGPCSFYFQDGELIDAQLDTLNGLQAVLIALSQPNASFNFNPLIQPPRRSISQSSEKVILELLGCWDEKTIGPAAGQDNARAFAQVGPTAPGLARGLAEVPVEVPAEELAEAARGMLPPEREVLALPPAPAEKMTRQRHRRVLIGSAIISLLVSFVTVLALAHWMIKRDISQAISEVSRKQDDGSKSETTVLKTQAVKVLVRVEGGRVWQARVDEPQPGLEPYEALALRIARQRRYAATASGQEVVSIKINAPE